MTNWTRTDWVWTTCFVLSSSCDHDSGSRNGPGTATASVYRRAAFSWPPGPARRRPWFDPHRLSPPPPPPPPCGLVSLSCLSFLAALSSHPELVVHRSAPAQASYSSPSPFPSSFSLCQPPFRPDPRRLSSSSPRPAAAPHFRPPLPVPLPPLPAARRHHPSRPAAALSSCLGMSGP